MHDADPTAAPAAPMPAANLAAIVLAAGRGERMRPLSDRTPKPLLPVHGQPMIEWHLAALGRAGVRDVVVNTAWLEAQFPAVLGDGRRHGVAIRYSAEGRDHGGALDVAGGIAKALPWLGQAFWVVSGDVVAPGFDFDAALARRFAACGDDAWLWLVPNPDHHPQGDFALDADADAAADAAASAHAAPPRVRSPARGEARPLTWASLALMRARLFADLSVGTVAPLGPRLHAAARAGRVGGFVFDGPWCNVGTPAQLAALQSA